MFFCAKHTFHGHRHPFRVPLQHYGLEWLVDIFCSAACINLFYCTEVMAVSAELLDDLVGVIDDLATDLDEVKQYCAKAIAQLAGFCACRGLFILQRYLAYEAEAVESHIASPRMSVCLQILLGRSSIPCRF